MTIPVPAAPGEVAFRDVDGDQVEENGRNFVSDLFVDQRESQYHQRIIWHRLRWPIADSLPGSKSEERAVKYQDVYHEANFEGQCEKRRLHLDSGRGTRSTRRVSRRTVGVAQCR